MDLFRRLIKEITALRPVKKAPEPPAHPLATAAKRFIDAAIARDMFCDERIYPAATAAGIPYRRLSKTKRFVKLQELVAVAIAKNDDKTKAQQKALQDLAKESKPFRKFMNGANAGLFENAIKNHLSLGHNYKGPDITPAINAFFTEAESYLTQEADRQWKRVRDEIERMQKGLQAKEPKEQKRPNGPPAGPKR